MPFAGRRESGYGVGGIPYTAQEMTAEKMIVFKRYGRSSVPRRPQPAVQSRRSASTGAGAIKSASSAARPAKSARLIAADMLIGVSASRTAIAAVQIRLAHASCHDANPHLVGTRIRQFQGLDQERC